MCAEEHLRADCGSEIHEVLVPFNYLSYCVAASAGFFCDYAVLYAVHVDRYHDLNFFLFQGFGSWHLIQAIICKLFLKVIIMYLQCK